MNERAITIEHLSKKYRLGQVHTDLLSERVSHLLRRRRRANSEAQSDFWALRDINLHVQKGDVVGIIGRNGAGKSTLLKILSRLTAPTEGRALIHGRLASLLEVGTGFHPELTGRENIYLNATILGMRRREIDRRFDSIVEFSGVEAFLETPVKRYSSGMYVRLAFAVAAHVEADILVVDEVLAVGDAEFQRRCLGKMREVARGGRTVLFVSHNLAALRNLCTAGLVLEKGTVIGRGTVDECITLYGTRDAETRGSTWRRPSTGEKPPLSIENITCALSGRQPKLTLEVEIDLQSTSQHASAFVAIDIADSAGVVLLQAIPRLEGFLTPETRGQRMHVSVELPPLVPDRYLAGVWVGSQMTRTLDEVKEAVAFDVHDSPSPGRGFPHTKDHGYAVPASSAWVRDEQAK